MSETVRRAAARRPLAAGRVRVTVDAMDPAQGIRAGDFLLTTIDGAWANTAVWAGQLACGDLSRYTHAAICVGGPDRLVIEMAPGGLAVRELAEFAGRPLAVSSWPLTDDQRDSIVTLAWWMHRKSGARYGWLNYPLIGWARLSGDPLIGWARRYLASERWMICSQFVDTLYLAAGVHLFADGRLPGLVTPGDLTQVLSQPKTG